MGIIPCAKSCHLGKESPPSQKLQQQTSHTRPTSATSSSTDHDKNILLSKSISLSSQTSLRSLPSLDSHLHPTSPLLHRCITTLRGHSSAVSALAVAGDHLFSGSSDHDIRVWSPGGGDDNPGRLAAAGKSAVKSLVVSGDRLFSAHQDGRIRAWRIHHGGDGCLKLLATLPTAGDRLRSMLSAENYVEVRRHVRRTWVHHVDAVSALAVSNDGSHLYSVSWDRSLKVWRTSDYRCVESVADAHHDAINTVAVGGDGVVFTGSADATVKAWRWSPAAVGTTMERHRSGVNAVAATGGSGSSSPVVVYSGAGDRSVVVWGEEEDGDGGGTRMVVTGALRGHAKAVLCLAVVGEVVCSGSADKTVRVWRRRRGEGGGGGWEKGSSHCYTCLAVLEGHQGPVKCLAVAAVEEEEENHVIVYTGSMDCDIKVWKVLIPLSD